MNPGVRRVAVLTLGGTIAGSRLGGGTGVVPTLDPADLLAAVPGLEASGIDLELHDVRRLPGPSLRFADLGDLYRQVAERLAAGSVHGAVVTQGTDTIEETCYLLDLLHGAAPSGVAEAPLVVTGAMRNPALPGADGPANLLAAIQTAASTAACGLGCVVVFADEVHAARWVRKTHSSSITAFSSPNAGPIGHVSEGCVGIWAQPPRVRIPALERLADASAMDGTRVALASMALGDDGPLLAGADLDGVVVAGFGTGHVPSWLVGHLEALAGRVPVVLASRTGAGPVTTSTYAYPGSESDLLARGLVSAGYLDPYKARILLKALLAAGAARTEITDAFAVAGALGEVP